ncbi:MAG: tetratricopeptide repeat protein [Propionibacteriaceae bacterium]
MSSSSFNRPGAVDLSQLAKAAAPAPAGGGGRSGGSYVIDVDEASFDQTVVRASLQHPVVVEFHSPRVQGGQQLSDLLVELATEYAGKVLLARVNVDTAPRIVQALQQQGALQAVPTVIGVIGGQLAPLFQGVVPKDQAKSFIDELVKAAVANGIVGRAEPVGGAEPAPEENGDPNARFAEADAALERGDFSAARTEFERLLAADPGDAEAKAGLAQVGLLDRVSTLDPGAVETAIAQPDPPLSARLDAADIQLVSGDAEGAFSRLIDIIRSSAGEDRETVRKRLLELFETLGNTDARVKKARTQLMSALF